MLFGASWNEIELCALLLVLITAHSYIAPVGEWLGGLFAKGDPPG
jgi:hypothetical protein